VPIGIVACIEGFFRAAVRAFFDAGDLFAARAADLPQAREMKVDFDVLRAIHGRRISAGELVAHVVPLNNLENVNSVISTLIGRDFFEQVKTAHSRWRVEVHKEATVAIISDPPRVLKDVQEMFRLRHIYAHELVQFDQPDRAYLGTALESSVAFLEASSEVVAELLHPNAPLTQTDMTERAHDDLHAAENRMSALLEEIFQHVEDSARAEALRASQEAWLVFRRSHAMFAADECRGGSISPMIYAIAAKALTDQRIEHLEGIVRELRRGAER
jgi:uncharacterized protein YecT (DUF1311 family)